MFYNREIDYFAAANATAPKTVKTFCPVSEPYGKCRRLHKLTVGQAVLAVTCARFHPAVDNSKTRSQPARRYISWSTGVTGELALITTS